jgi:hypothetical protein
LLNRSILHRDGIEDSAESTSGQSKLTRCDDIKRYRLISVDHDLGRVHGMDRTMDGMDLSSHIDEILKKTWVDLHNQVADSFRHLDGSQYPGVYALAYTNANLDGQVVEPKDIFYIGMSTSRGGVRQRLKQFLRGIERSHGHSAGNRFFLEHANGNPWSEFKHGNDGKKFYVVFVSIPCKVEKEERTADDLRKMGNVAALEYYMIAYLKECLGKEPELNKQ